MRRRAGKKSSPTSFLHLVMNLSTICRLCSCGDSLFSPWGPFLLAGPEALGGCFLLSFSGLNRSLKSSENFSVLEWFFGLWGYLKWELKSCSLEGNARQRTLQPILPLSNHLFHIAGLPLSVPLHLESLALRLSICSLSRYAENCANCMYISCRKINRVITAQKGSKKQK